MTIIKSMKIRRSLLDSDRLGCEHNMSISNDEPDNDNEVNTLVDYDWNLTMAGYPDHRNYEQAS